MAGNNRVKALSKSLTPSFFPEPQDPKKMGANSYTSKVRVRDKYIIIGFISSGTYGRVYKAKGRQGQKGEFAIKK
jgi:cyclin-dependent kinase 8/11